MDELCPSLARCLVLCLNSPQCFAEKGGFHCVAGTLPLLKEQVLFQVKWGY